MGREIKGFFIGAVFGVLLAIPLMLYFLKLPLTLSGAMKLLSVNEEAEKSEDLFLADFENSYHSFNTLYLRDKSGKNFWDYFPDYPAKLMRSKGRSFVLREGVPFFMLTQDQEFPQASLYPLAHPYSRLERADKKGSQIYFTGANRKEFLNTLLGDPEGASLWKDGRWFLFFTPYKDRPINSLGQRSYRSPPTQEYMLMKVHQGELIKKTVPGLEYAYGGHKKGQLPKTLDTYFRSLKRRPGGINQMVRAIKVVSYVLEKGSGGMYLVRYDWKGIRSGAVQSDSIRTVIASRVNSVEIQRPSVSSTMIDVKVK